MVAAAAAAPAAATVASDDGTTKECKVAATFQASQLAMILLASSFSSQLDPAENTSQLVELTASIVVLRIVLRAELDF